jgi:hypothetical protein
MSPNGSYANMHKDWMANLSPLAPSLSKTDLMQDYDNLKHIESSIESVLQGIEKYISAFKGLIKLERRSLLFRDAKDKQ